MHQDNDAEYWSYFWAILNKTILRIIVISFFCYNLYPKHNFFRNIYLILRVSNSLYLAIPFVLKGNFLKTE